MDINQYRRNYLSSGRSAFETAVSTTDLYTACADRRKLGRRAHHFNTKLTVQPKPTNQRSSGRCWLFAALNMVRNRMMVEKKLDSGFQLSQNHLFFWDKFERANYFLRKEVELSKKDNMGKEGEKVPDRLWDELYKTPLQDGGQWTMVVNLVKKYGLVPQSVYRDSHHSTHSRPLNRLLNHKLREWGNHLHSMDMSLTRSVDRFIDKCMEQVYQLLSLTLGQPIHPDEEFTWEYTDKKGGVHSVTTTPLDFYTKQSGMNLDDYVSVVHDPRNEYGTKMTVDHLGNLYGKPGAEYHNLSMPQMERLAADMISSNTAVWFGCDMGPFRNPTASLMDPEVFNYQGVLGVPVLKLDKENRMYTQDSLLTHAMVFTAVHLDEKKTTQELDSLDGSTVMVERTTRTPVRWRVENSWGSAGEENGYYTMSRSWFQEYVYEIVAPRKEVMKLINPTKPVKVLPLWDPMGALA